MTRSACRFPLLFLLLAGCTSYQGARPVEAIPAQPLLRERFEIWSQGTGHQLHSLQVTADSVSGVPWWKDPRCDSCRVAFLRTAVDSVRGREFDAAETTALAGGEIGPFVLFPPLILILLAIISDKPVM